MARKIAILFTESEYKDTLMVKKTVERKWVMFKISRFLAFKTQVRQLRGYNIVKDNDDRRCHFCQVCDCRLIVLINLIHTLLNVLTDDNSKDRDKRQCLCYHKNDKYKLQQL